MSKGLLKLLEYEGFNCPDTIKVVAKLCAMRAMKDKDLVMAISGEEGCQPKGSKVLMSNGEWKNIEDIKIGDKVLSPQKNGSYSISSVISTTSWYSNENYEVKELNRNNKTLYKCSSNHLIPINQRVIPRVKGRKRTSKDGYWILKNRRADQITKLSRHRKKNITTPMAPAIPFFEGQINCEIEPYTLGAWLGDGHFSSSIGITIGDPEIMKEIERFYPIQRIYLKKNTYAKQYVFSKIGLLANQLRKEGLQGKLSGDKFIPKSALLSDVDYRKRLLAGLIDTDGTLAKNSSYSITTKSHRLANDILYLVKTLGGRGNICKTRKGIKSTGFIGDYFRVSFYLGNFAIPIILERKKRSPPYFYLSSNRVSIGVIKSEPCSVYGFEIDSESHLYITDDFMVTHNSGKSSLAMLLGVAIHSYLIEYFEKEGIEFPDFDLEKNMIYTNETQNLSKFLKEMPKYSVIVPDEAIKFLYKQNWGNAGQKYINVLYSLARRENKITILPIPRFTDINEFFRNHRVKIWIHIVKEGHAIMFMKDWSPFSNKDIWRLQDNEKLIEKLRKQRKLTSFTHSEKMRIFRQCRNYVIAIKFPRLPAKLYEEYKRLSSSKYDDLEDIFQLDKNKKKIPYKEALKNMLEELKDKHGYDMEKLAYLTGLNPKVITKLLYEEIE